MLFIVLHSNNALFSSLVEILEQYDEDTAGGFIPEPPKKRQRKGKTVAKKSKVIDLSPPISQADSGASTPDPQVTAPTSVSPDEEDSDSILTIPMSSKQARTLSRASRRSRRSSAKVTYTGLDTESNDDEESDDDYKEEEKENEDNEADEEEKQETVKEEITTAEPETLAPAKPRRRRRARTTQPPSTGPRPSRYEALMARIRQGLYDHHPHLENVFERIEAEGDITPKAIDQPPGMTIQLLPFQKEGLNWLIQQEKSRYKGGILADEMGMGKTIQTVALFMSDDPATRSGPNLVIAPTVALMQWKNEIDSHTGGALKVLIYHGRTKTVSKAELLKYDVILTTYSLLESVYRKQQSGFKRKGETVKEKSVLHNIEFHRVVLDEAHNVKDRHSSTTRAVSSLTTERRLCLSGTPLQNRIGELYSLLKFLKVRPLSQYFCRKCECESDTWDFQGSKCRSCGHLHLFHTNFFNHSILHHLQRERVEGGANESMKHLRLLLKRLMLRRTKIERADDLGLPPRVVEIRRDFFNEEEKDLYESIYSDSTRKFNTYVAQGVVLNNYANIFTLITRMRQLSDHPDLVLKRHLTDEGMVVNTIVCQLCDDEAEEPIESKCHHTFCRTCITEYVQGWTGEASELQCPVCHIGLSIDLTAPAMVSEVSSADTKKSKSSIINRINMTGGWRSSTKIEALVEELYKLRNNRQTIKSIVFSQFTSMLDLVEWRLNKAGFQTVKLKGSMSPIQRDAIINHFMSTPAVEVFLVSLKAGGVALNLCEASQVFIMDPWWNPSVEWQSGDRVHRIGQHRPVKITRLIIEDSIESRIVELQEKKATMINATISQDDSAMQRLTPADMQFLFQI